jgi:hypothetical protein
MMKLSRAALYELVWSQPMTAIARLYGVRDLQIAQACDYYDIARPPAGHWQRLAHGKKVQKTDLSTIRFSADDIVIIAPSAGRTSRTWRRAENLEPRRDAALDGRRKRAEL